MWPEMGRIAHHNFWRRRMAGRSGSEEAELEAATGVGEGDPLLAASWTDDADLDGLEGDGPSPSALVAQAHRTVTLSSEDDTIVEALVGAALEPDDLADLQADPGQAVVDGGAATAHESSGPPTGSSPTVPAIRDWRRAMPASHRSGSVARRR